MKRVIGVVMVAGAMSIAAGQVVAEGENAKKDDAAQGGAKVEAVKKAVEQTTCPVMDGNKINKKQYADVKGKRIYVCCKGCIATIQKDPDTFIKKLEEQGVVLEKTPEDAGAEKKAEAPAKKE